MPKEKLPRSIVLTALTDKLKASSKYSVARCWMEVHKLATKNLKKLSKDIALSLDGTANIQADLPVTKAQTRAMATSPKDKTLITYVDEQGWL